ncbi:MAG: glycosyltransferase family 4 protein [Asgard group archaeon]|nr:glycosyltransferase family 4 protein [Asgard group archaeon]
MRRMSKALKNLNIEPIILTQITESNQEEEEVIDGIKVLRFNCGDLVDRIKKFNNASEDEKKILSENLFKPSDIENTAMKLAKEFHLFIKENKPKAIHIHNSYFITPYALYFLKQNHDTFPTTSFYFWSHSPTSKLVLPSGEESNLYGVLTSFQNLFKGVFAISKSVQNDMTKMGIKSKVNYIGINIDLFKKRSSYHTNFREKLGISENAFLLLYVGRIIEEKGLAVLPEIYNEMISRDKSFLTMHVLIVGDGRYKKNLEELIVSSKLEKRFHFLTVKSDDDLVDIYSCADCFILPSKREALGLSLIEAMSCSLPCIASDLPGIKELITHPQNGLIIPPENKAELIRWVSGLHTNKNLRKSLGSEARKTVEEYFNFRTHLDYFIKRLMK